MILTNVWFWMTKQYDGVLYVHKVLYIASRCPMQWDVSGAYPWCGVMWWSIEGGRFPWRVFLCLTFPSLSTSLSQHLFQQEVPAGDWYCDRCRPKERPKSPRKKRQIYCEESDEEEEEQYRWAVTVVSRTNTFNYFLCFILGLILYSIV